MAAPRLDEITPSAAPSIAKLETAKWFDASHRPASNSPIDEFLENLHKINALYLQADNRKEYNAILGSLVYLGMVSAAEGYFRSLLRQLILIDDLCQGKAATKAVSYGAAVHYEQSLLPEALLEGVSLASAKNVAAELKNLCGIASLPGHMGQLFENFEAICQIRHCGIHRFGKLGSQQALLLGMDLHKVMMEKPLKLDVPQLQEIAEAIEALVRGVNSHCFLEIIQRTHALGPQAEPEDRVYQWVWTRDAAQDRGRFHAYYQIFSSAKKPNESPSLEDLYVQFVAYMDDFDAKSAKKALGKARGKASVAASDGSAITAPPESVGARSVTVRLSEEVPAATASAAKAEVGFRGFFRKLLGW